MLQVDASASQHTRCLSPRYSRCSRVLTSIRGEHTGCLSPFPCAGPSAVSAQPVCWRHMRARLCRRHTLPRRCGGRGRACAFFPPLFSFLVAFGLGEWPLVRLGVDRGWGQLVSSVMVIGRKRPTARLALMKGRQRRGGKGGGGECLLRGLILYGKASLAVNPTPQLHLCLQCHGSPGAPDRDACLVSESDLHGILRAQEKPATCVCSVNVCRVKALTKATEVERQPRRERAALYTLDFKSYPPPDTLHPKPRCNEGPRRGGTCFRCGGRGVPLAG